jgi:hypothetical protein
MREQTCSKSALTIRIHGTKRGWTFGVLRAGISREETALGPDVCFAPADRRLQIGTL